MVTAGTERLAFTSYNTRGISGTCAATPRERAYNGRLLALKGLYGSADLVCTTTTSVGFSVHPITGLGDAIIGGTMVVYIAPEEGERPQIIVSAVVKNRSEGRVASRVYFAPRYCRKG